MRAFSAVAELLVPVSDYTVNYRQCHVSVDDSGQCTCYQHTFRGAEVTYYSSRQHSIATQPTVTVVGPCPT